MKAPATALLLAAVALAGCTDTGPADFSSERLVVSVLDLGDGYSMGIPLWIAPGGAQPMDWLAAASIISGNVTLSLRNVEQGTALWLEGSGNARFDIEDLLSTVTGAAPEAFLAGEYTLGSNAAGRPFMVIELGDVDVTWQYAGKSRDCFLPLNHAWTNRQAGTHVAEYGQRQDPRHDCIRSA